MLVAVAVVLATLVSTGAVECCGVCEPAAHVEEGQAPQSVAQLRQVSSPLHYKMREKSNMSEM